MSHTFLPAGGGLRRAVAFLTVLPVGRPDPERPLGTAAPWFPLVGAVVGGLSGAVDYLLEPSLGRLVAAVIAAGVLVTTTGGLHQDGLADCADGLGVRWDRDRRLAVMRDSSIGAFGTLALILWLLLLVAGLSGLARRDAAIALVLAAASGRWAAVVHAALTPSARPDGLGAAFAVRPAGLALATAAVLVIDVVAAGPARGLAGLAAAAIVAVLFSAWSARALGGRTGDTLGASVAVAEVAVVVLLLGLAGGGS